MNPSSRFVLSTFLLVVGARASAQDLAPVEAPPSDRSGEAVGSEDTPTPSPEAATDTPVVAYGTVDAATVRIFAVGDVRAARVRGRLYPRVLALPEVGHGSGVIVDPRGVVVTAAHVVEGAHHVAVRLPGATEVLAARVVHRDRELDFALLLVLAESPFPAVVPLPEEAPTLTVRQTVDAIGYPLDASRENPQSTRGIVSAATEDGQLQLGISVNPGNSGGPLVDEDEHLVGIVVARGDPSRGVQGIGFGVPVAPIRRAYDGVLRNGRMQRSYLALRQDPALERRRAEIVDALVRFGGLDVLLEALESVEQSTSAERLAHFEQMADTIDDLPLLELLAAFFWDATLVILERSGGQTRAATLPDGPAREWAMRAEAKARELARRIDHADASRVRRSAFLRHLRGVRLPAPEPDVPAPAGDLQITSTPGRGWMPTVYGGYVQPMGWPASSLGFQTGLVVPVALSGNVESKVRASLGVGFLYEYHFVQTETDVYLDVGYLVPHVGATVRLGSRQAAFVAQAAWAPTFRVVHGGGIPNDDQTTRGTALGVRLLAGVAFSNFFAAFSLRADDLSPLVEGVGRPYALGVASGGTF
ncbi:MAG: trypsin-like peptidase domain-containing protein [Sandaracinus sp.]|nr:trypsin-like peptidase domain-containing protein [Sandaracinus sp.]